MKIVYLEEINQNLINVTIRTNAKWLFLTRLISYSPSCNSAVIQHKKATLRVDTSLLEKIKQIDIMYMFIGDLIAVFNI